MSIRAYHLKIVCKGTDIWSWEPTPNCSCHHSDCQHQVHWTTVAEQWTTEHSLPTPRDRASGLQSSDKQNIRGWLQGGRAAWPQSTTPLSKRNHVVLKSRQFFKTLLNPKVGICIWRLIRMNKIIFNISLYLQYCLKNNKNKNEKTKLEHLNLKNI